MSSALYTQKDFDEVTSRIKDLEAQLSGRQRSGAGEITEANVREITKVNDTTFLRPVRFEDAFQYTQLSAIKKELKLYIDKRWGAPHDKLMRWDRLLTEVKRAHADDHRQMLAARRHMLAALLVCVVIIVALIVALWLRS